MKLNNINSVYSLANILYGVTINPDNFEDIVLNGLQLIGNKHSRMYRYVGDTTNRILELPCNLSFIESVTIPFEDFQSTSDTSIFHQFKMLIMKDIMKLENEIKILYINQENY